MFKTNPVSLQELLNKAHNGQIQLPDFQRGWVWDDCRIKGLLASISRGFPVGAVLTLGARGAVRFKARLVQGVDLDSAPDASEFLLDGQQRLTSLYQALRHSGPVEVHKHGKKTRRWYYIDMKEATAGNGDHENAIVSVPDNKIGTRNFSKDVLDLSCPEREYEQHMFPAKLLFDMAPTWQLKYIQYWNNRGGDQHTGDPVQFYKEFTERVIQSFHQYQLPVIQLDKATPKEAVCTVFEKVNTSGVSLTVFELVTASFAAESEGFSLRDDWAKRREKMHLNFGGVLQGIDGMNFLQAVTLLKTQEDRMEAMKNGQDANRAPPISCKKRDILSLRLEHYCAWADRVESGFRHAAKFLLSEYVYGRHNVPYNTQLVPLAALYVHLGRELDPASAKEKLARWYWSGIFGEAYGGAIETRYSEDLAQVTEYIRGGSEPSRIEQASFLPERLLTLRTRKSAAYKGVHALLMKKSARDWNNGSKLDLLTYLNENIDIHHVFPVAWCKRKKISSGVYNSVINKTPLSARTNKMLGGDGPSVYLKQLVKVTGDDERLRRVLATHLIEMEHMKTNNFSDFFVERGESLLRLIGEAIGRELGGGEGVFLAAVERASGGEPEEAEPEYSPYGEFSPADDGAGVGS